ncbi:MAG: sirohydrochlorin cobaltochelatase [Oscillospiraceae bacterium]|nr:sirohydrochlorin cobaltochelatase [Oscillospiraceae bacterium]
MKKLTAYLLTAAMFAAMTAGCAGNQAPAPEAPTTEAATTAAETTEETTEAATEAPTEAETPAEEDDEENYDTGDASLDNVRNQDEIGDNELLVLSFGTSFNDSRRLTIGAIEDELEKEIPDYSVRRGFTANIIIDHVNRRDGILIDDVDAALDRAIANGVKNLVVQPTHLMNGLEYNDLVEQVGNKADAFESVSFGEPLLTSDDDFKRVETAITDWTKDYDDDETAIVFMGHGTEADSNAVYQKMQDLLAKDGFANYYIGTVESSPSLDDVLAAVQKGEYKRVVLEPLMVVAGDHANNDMASDEDDSWKTAFTNAGYEVECVLRGLGENEEIRKLYVEHAKAAIEKIK